MAYREYDRVRERTPRHVNDRIDATTAEYLSACDGRSSSEIEARLAQLDREWDIDQAVMANFSVAGSISLLLGKKHKAWMGLFWMQMGFLLYHAAAGWCPPVPVMRRRRRRPACRPSCSRSRRAAWQRWPRRRHRSGTKSCSCNQS